MRLPQWGGPNETVLSFGGAVPNLNQVWFEVVLDFIFELFEEAVKNAFGRVVKVILPTYLGKILENVIVIVQSVFMQRKFLIKKQF